MTVEQIIQESVKEFKQSHQRARREHVRKLIDYYCGSNTGNYISQFLMPTLSEKFLAMKQILQEDLSIK